MVLPSFISRFICSLVGHVYPAYSTYFALQHRNNYQCQRWLMYWIVLGFFHLAEATAETFIFWFPFYQEFRVFIFCYLALPQAQGANYLYRTYLEPYLVRHHVQIEARFRTFRQRAERMFGQVSQNVSVAIAEYISQLAQDNARRSSTPADHLDTSEFDNVSTSSRIFEVQDEGISGGEADKVRKDKRA